MRRTPPIRSALLGISGVTAALLIGFTPSGATAATHATAQQSHPTVATHTTGALLPCGTVEQETGSAYGYASPSPLNIRNGPMTSCPVVTKAHWYHRLQYYCTYGGWTYLRDSWNGKKGWATNEALSHRGAKNFCGFGLQQHHP
jgi:uncharacterized protein YraI